MSGTGSIASAVIGSKGVTIGSLQSAHPNYILGNATLTVTKRPVNLSGRRIRGGTTDILASELSSIAEVRDSLFDIQRAFYTNKGLVADGRDMGTVVFKDAKLKIYLTASVDVRASRRFLELQKRGQEVNMPALIADIEQRDLKDSSRELSPLLPADDAHVIDSSDMSLEDVIIITKNLIKEEYL